MKETKVYIDELPKSCTDCPCYDFDMGGCQCKDPHLTYDSINRFKGCPLIDIKIHDRELVEKVIENQQKRIAELEQELAELKEKAIVPKFKIGQEIWEITPLMPWKIKRIEWHKFNGGHGDVVVEIYRLGHDGTDDYNCCIMPVDSDRFFTTEQEAQDKLKEIQGNE